jgi:hypothetical protein
MKCRSINLFRHDIPSFFILTGCQMPHTDTYNNSSATAFLPTVKEQGFQMTQEVLFRMDTKKTASVMAKPVNNYLKTEEEIETEFCFANFNLSKSNKDGYSNIHSLDNITISGTMEENY